MKEITKRMLEAAEKDFWRRIAGRKSNKSAEQENYASNVYDGG